MVNEINANMILLPIHFWPIHDDVIKWKHFLHYWPFVRGVHRSPVNSLHKGQWRGALMFSLICAWLNSWINNGEAGDLRRNRAHYDITIMLWHKIDGLVSICCVFLLNWMIKQHIIKYHLCLSKQFMTITVTFQWPRLGVRIYHHPGWLQMLLCHQLCHQLIKSSVMWSVCWAGICGLHMWW